MTIKHDRKTLENLCAVSQDMSRRITTCEKRGHDGARVDYDDLICWCDCVGDAIEVIHRNLEESNERV